MDMFSNFIIKNLVLAATSINLDLDAFSGFIDCSEIQKIS